MPKKRGKVADSLPPIDDPLIDQAARIIKDQSQSLKSDLEAAIDKKLKQKIKSQQAEIQNLRHCIDQLKADNQGLYKNADSKLMQLDDAVKKITQMADELNYIKTQSVKLKEDCNFIKQKFEETSLTISNSLENLGDLVNQKASEGDEVAEAVESLKADIEAHQQNIETKLDTNQQEIDDQINEIRKEIVNAINKAGKEAQKHGSCCVIV
ncbi:Oidioi.mRNA.OKI2018_I69.XSR.g16019.t1.cds [Oikopleura dioica]|uniref:Oidioi.mRNA.OKI2018_I69.XSR.g16019.t1.cds n=1 Tax=Oikopleura dioica TaxID=34765 RepID=A0ABN7SEN4_OIKDI|nr:Oidioi.mRNA.OKI2018_I69.XSR.g16019.t1.cds [Oikopleura dioica]